MSTAEEQIQRISAKLAQLLRQFEAVQRENERLRAELLPAKERELQFLEQISELEQKILVARTGTGRLSDVEKKELDKKLHGYLKEIDKCIAMLSE